MNEQISNYIRGKVLEILIVGGVSYVTFAILDLRYSALLAVAVGLSVLIPYIGAAAVTVPVAIVGLFQWGPCASVLLVAACLRYYPSAGWQCVGSCSVF